MSFCFMIQSKSDVMKYIKDYFATNFDTKRSFHIGCYCYTINNSNMYVFSYSFSSTMIKSEADKRSVSFFLSDIAVDIFKSLIDNNIEFNFSFIDLRHKEDEETIFRNIVKDLEIEFEFNSPYCIKERRLYRIR